MGSPISPCLAELVLEHLESEVLKILKQKGIRTDFYVRYVDDCLLAANSRHIEKILWEFNTFDVANRIKFTIEHEQSSSIPFLDLRIHRESDGSLSFDWYHKDTWSGRYLNFESYLPMTYKRNTVKILRQKILELADPKFHDKNFTLLEETLINNGYPQSFIYNASYQTQSPTPTSTEPIKYVSLPYDDVLFGRLKSLLEPWNIRAVGRPQAPLKSLVFSQLKDPVEKRWQSDVVYEIQCECEATYVGQTHQHALTRFVQHQNGGPEHSSLSAHLTETGHEITFENLKILCSEPSTKIRLIKEAILIRKGENRLNSQIESKKVNDVYHKILDLKLVDHPTDLNRTITLSADNR